MNASEIQFENLCKTSGITYQRIPEGERKSPDYFIKGWDFNALVEIKEICPNPEEKRLARLPLEEWGEKECTYYGGPPGDRIRNKINDAMKQFKAYQGNEFPYIIVIANLTIYPELTDQYAITSAMFGYEAILISSEVAPEGGAKILKRWHGHGKKTTTTHNRSLSAIGVLDMTQPLLHIFHNPYAVKPISNSTLNSLSFIHMRVCNDPSLSFAVWQEQKNL
ncbi:MAG: hypothetical protein LBH01_00025 [Verrucomicrobiales bacterium]|nr:hypothetical protein [Verrucomicrobiales bacterium]